MWLVHVNQLLFMKPSIRFILFLFCAILFYSCQDGDLIESSTNVTAWDICREIEKTIQVPVFNDTQFNVLDYKAAQGTDSDAFKLAIEA